MLGNVFTFSVKSTSLKDAGGCEGGLPYSSLLGRKSLCTQVSVSSVWLSLASRGERVKASNLLSYGTAEEVCLEQLVCRVAHRCKQ